MAPPPPSLSQIVSVPPFLKWLQEWWKTLAMIFAIGSGGSVYLGKQTETLFGVVSVGVFIFLYVIITVLIWSSRSVASAVEVLSKSGTDQV